jgi:hypothetical protein
VEALLISLLKIVEEQAAGERELRFFRNSVSCLSAISNPKNLQREPWMITSFDIEFGREIGSGG